MKLSHSRGLKPLRNYRTKQTTSQTENHRRSVEGVIGMVDWPLKWKDIHAKNQQLNQSFRNFCQLLTGNNNNWTNSHKKWEKSNKHFPKWKTQRGCSLTRIIYSEYYANVTRRKAFHKPNDDVIAIFLELSLVNWGKFTSFKTAKIS